jgi:hypothetical protein
MGTAEELYNDEKKAVVVKDEIGQDASVGEYTDYQPTPEGERRLLWKLDML